MGNRGKGRELTFLPFFSVLQSFQYVFRLDNIFTDHVCNCLCDFYDAMKPSSRELQPFCRCRQECSSGRIHNDTPLYVLRAHFTVIKFGNLMFPEPLQLTLTCPSYPFPNNL